MQNDVQKMIMIKERNLKFDASIRTKVSAMKALPVNIFILKRNVKNTVLLDRVHKSGTAPADTQTNVSFGAMENAGGVTNVCICIRWKTLVLLHRMMSLRRFTIKLMMIIKIMKTIWKIQLFLEKTMF